MLPYQPRPPLYGGRKRESMALQDLHHPYQQGGPWQRAIYLDFLHHGANFQQELLKASTATATTLKPGSAFSVFKVVFGQARMAAVFTRLLPPRVDRGSLAQLVYAACLQALRQAFKDHEDDKNETSSDQQDEIDEDDNPRQENLFLEATFAVFLLYAMDESNPLPYPPNPKDANHGRDNDPMSLMPTQLLDRENHKAVFRRNWKSPIRIDVEHYGYLLCLRELALAATADTSFRLKNISDDDVNRAAAARSRSMCGTDVIVVLDRLWHLLEFTSYTGPCSLEGLAGHQDYFAGAKGVVAEEASTTTKPTPTAVPEKQATVTTGAASVSATETTSWSEKLQTSIKDYLAARQAIRLPVPSSNNKSTRIRESLATMFRQDRAKVYSRLQGYHQRARVTFQNEPSVHGGVSFHPDTISQEDRHSATDAPVQSVQTTIAVDLKLEGLDAALQASVQAAVATLLQREPTLDQDMTDVSTVGASSVVSGMGQKALQELLKAGSSRPCFLASDRSATTASTRLSRESKLAKHRTDVSTVDTSSAVSGVGQKALQELLKAARARSDISASDKSTANVSLFGRNNGDASTVATSSVVSGVGQKALRELLKAASLPSGFLTTDSNIKREKPPVAATFHDKRKREDDDESVLSDLSDEERAMSTVGQSALQDLLSRAVASPRPKRKTKPRAKTQPKKQSKSQDKKLQRKMARKQMKETSSEDEAAEENLDEEDDDSSESDESLGQGQLALAELLANANLPV